LNITADPGRQYVASLTGLRGVAALFVFIFHYGYFNPGIRLDQSVPVIGYALQFPLGFGFAGVDLFFVLSGFLLALPFARTTLCGFAHPPLLPYYKRRLLRVFPAYYAQLAIILVVGTWFITYTPQDGTSLFAHVLMFFNIGWNPVRPMVGLWWTLPVELSFYLVLPLIAPLMQPRRWLVFLLLACSSSMLYRLWCVDHFATAPADAVFLAASHLPGSLPEFLLGASAAVLVQQFELHSFKRPTALMLDGLFLAGVVLANVWFWMVMLPYGGIFWSGHWSMVIAPVALGLPLTLIVVSLYWGSRLGQWLFANPVVYFLGLISYSLYLWHFVVLQQAELVFGETYTAMQGLPKFLLSLAMVVLISTISYYIFERPFFRLGARRNARSKAS